MLRVGVGTKWIAYEVAPQHLNVRDWDVVVEEDKVVAGLPLVAIADERSVKGPEANHR